MILVPPYPHYLATRPCDHQQGPEVPWLFAPGYLSMRKSE
jgi:hypothetical protein